MQPSTHNQHSGIDGDELRSRLIEGRGASLNVDISLLYVLRLIEELQGKEPPIQVFKEDR